MRTLRLLAGALPIVLSVPAIAGSLSAHLPEPGTPTFTLVGKAYADLGLNDPDFFETKNYVVTQNIAVLVDEPDRDTPPFDATDWTIVDICGDERTVEDSHVIEVAIAPTQGVTEEFLSNAQQGHYGNLTPSITCWRETHVSEDALDRANWWKTRPALTPIGWALSPAVGAPDSRD